MKYTGTNLGSVYHLNIWKGASILIFNWFTIAAIAIVFWRSKLVCGSGCDQRTVLVQIFGSSSPPRKFTCTDLGGVHRSNIWPGASVLIFNWFTIASIAIVYWRSKLVCSLGCVWQTLLEQIFASSSPPRKFILTKLRGVHRSNIHPGASTLIFKWFTIAAITIEANWCVSQSVFDECYWNKFLQVPLHPWCSP